MLYIKSGNAEIIVSDRKYTVSAGELVIVNPMDVHSIKADRSVPYHQRCICFDSSLIMDIGLREGLLSGANTITEFLPSSDVKNQKVASLFDSLFYSVLNDSEELFLESVAYISLIFAHLKKCGLIISKSDNKKRSLFVRKVQEYLSEHFNEQITSQDVSRELFYNQSYFCRLFRENYGISFLEYLMLYRISNAKLMLSTEKVRISDVAVRVGFLDASYFSRCFKKIVGKSPVEYQKCQSSRL